MKPKKIMPSSPVGLHQVEAVLRSPSVLPGLLRSPRSDGRPTVRKKKNANLDSHGSMALFYFEKGHFLVGLSLFASIT